MRRGYLTPASIPAATIERRICIPDEPYILAAVNGALTELTHPYNWELYGAITPDAIADEMLERVLTFQATEGLCMPILREPVILRHDEAQNTSGGGSTAGSWQKAKLNTLIDIPVYGATLVSDEFTLPAGRWMIEWSTPFNGGNKVQSRLFEVTGNTPFDYGSSELAIITTGSQIRSVGSTIAYGVTPTKYRIERKVQTSQATTGYGVAANQGPERYTIVKCFPLT